jgi:hypothetical protein
VDMVTLLLMFGADPDVPTTSRANGAGYQSGGESCRMIVERMIKTAQARGSGNPETRKARAQILKLFQDKKALDAAGERPPGSGVPAPSPSPHA